MTCIEEERICTLYSQMKVPVLWINADQKIPSVRNVFAVLLPIFQVNGALENRTYFFKAEDCLFEFAALSKAI